jgi:hypothetical protein
VRLRRTSDLGPVSMTMARPIHYCRRRNPILHRSSDGRPNKVENAQFINWD